MRVSLLLLLLPSGLTLALTYHTACKTQQAPTERA